MKLHILRATEAVLRLMGARRLSRRVYGYGCYLGSKAVAR